MFMGDVLRMCLQALSEQHLTTVAWLKDPTAVPSVNQDIVDAHAQSFVHHASATKEQALSFVPVQCPTPDSPLDFTYLRHTSNAEQIKKKLVQESKKQLRLRSTVATFHKGPVNKSISETSINLDHHHE